MVLYRTSNGEKIVLGSGSCLGTGGEARIFVVPEHPLLVAKVYHRRADQYTRKLKAMLADPPSDPTISSGHVSIVWPTDLLTEHHAQGPCVGFLMPRLTGMAPIIDFFHPRTRRAACPLFNYLYLHRTARNLAACFHALHEKGYVIGDVNESNILVKETAMVSMVDTDSFQIPDRASGEVYRCPVGKPDYTPRELHGAPFDQEDRTTEHDLFGLAVLLFQLLMEGTHPFAGVYRGRGEAPIIEERIASGDFPFVKKWRARFVPPPAAPKLEILHPRLRELFLLCFCEGHREPAQRPSAAAWRDALTQAESDLITCPANEQHRYGSHLAGCPWCDRVLQLGGLDPFPSPDAIKLGQHQPPVTAPQTPLAAPATPPPAQAPAGGHPALWRIRPLSQTALYQSSARILQAGSSGERWPWVVKAGLGASWALALASGLWMLGVSAGAVITFFGLRAARQAASARSVVAQPVLWLCLVSLLVQLCFYLGPSTMPGRIHRLAGLVNFARWSGRNPPKPERRLPQDDDLFTFAPAKAPLTLTNPPAADPPAADPPAAEPPAASPPAADPPEMNPPATAPVIPERAIPRTAKLERLGDLRRTNSLGMQFVPVPHPDCPVLVSVWETRVQDFDVFAKETGYAWPNPAALEPGLPAVNVNWNGAASFCRWLTARERAAGSIKPEAQYRLPSRKEWAAALGLADDPYPWGPQWPAPEGTGNFYETRWRQTHSAAPVGSFVANEFGLYDLAGNVWEWALDSVPQKPNERPLLGGSYRTSLKDAARLKTDEKNTLAADKSNPDVGFRIVLENQMTREPGAARSSPGAAILLPLPDGSRRWANSLGMRFVPLAGSNILAAMWETRVRDYAAFVQANRLDLHKPRFAQTEDHPVVNVSWEEAQAFCRWLTEKEHLEARIGPGQKYRLPTDLEWSRAMGLPVEPGSTPAERHDQRDRYGYPWGEKRRSVPDNFGNYSAGDDHSFTAPVASFPPNGLGLYDLSGNVSEWCREEMVPGRPVLRGGSFADPLSMSMPDPLLSAYRGSDPKDCRRETTGFRVVLDLNSSL
jgi:formylglycine-generating enzyme required for sulfatase activity